MDRIEILKNVRLGRYFTALEFCNSKDGYAIKMPDPDLFIKLDRLREIVGSITVTSGYRTPKFNNLVGGSANSYHVKGIAADIKFNFNKWTVENIRDLCVAIGFGNIGIYVSKSGIAWVHVDTGRRWNEVNGWVHHGDSAVKIYNV